ncbi:MAG: hypothetical protein CMO55_26095 [Verrucomicrobiales bacterium]|nr:hypothetical protein [Verrucomicrobiales bacterium]
MKTQLYSERIGGYPEFSFTGHRCGFQVTFRKILSHFIVPVVLLQAFFVFPALSADRLALVIGSDDYKNAAKLKNAVSDSQLVAKTLSDAGFQVIALENPGVDEFYGGLEQFKRHSSLAKVGLIYFAGHGLEVRGENYLLPVDAELSSSVQLRSQTVPLKTILDDLGETILPAKVVILDCCRDNPLSRSWMTTRSISKGLAAIQDTDIPDSSVIVYSAAPGEVAYDGSGENSPFSSALASELKRPGQNLFQSFLKTSDQVVDATRGAQEPWVKMDGAARAIRELVLVPEGDTKTLPAEKKEEKKVTQVGSDKVKVDPSPAGKKEPEPVGNKEEKTEPEPETTVGNTTEKMAPAEERKVAEEKTEEEEVKELVLPDRGYFTNAEVFDSGPYSAYNSYSQTNILRSAQGKLPGAGTPDGKMGGNTQTAIVTYQEENKLPVTGLLDEKTIKSLGLTGLPEETYTPPQRTASTPTRSSSSSSSSYTPPRQTYQPSPPPAPKKKKGIWTSGRDRDRDSLRKSHIERKRTGF